MDQAWNQAKALPVLALALEPMSHFQGVFGALTATVGGGCAADGCRSMLKTTEDVFWDRHTHYTHGFCDMRTQWVSVSTHIANICVGIACGGPKRCLQHAHLVTVNVIGVA